MPPSPDRHPLRSLALLLLVLLASPGGAASAPQHNKRDASHPPYLSSSVRQAPPRTFGLFSYARDPADLGPYDALLEVQNILLHRGLATVQMGDSVIRPLNEALSEANEVGPGTSHRPHWVLEGSGPGLAVSPVRGGQVLWSYAEQDRERREREREERRDDVSGRLKQSTAEGEERGEPTMKLFGTRAEDWIGTSSATLDRRYDDGMWHPEAPGGGAAYDDGLWHGDGTASSQSWTDEPASAQSDKLSQLENQGGQDDQEAEADTSADEEAIAADSEVEGPPTDAEAAVEQPAEQSTEEEEAPAGRPTEDWSALTGPPVTPGPAPDSASSATAQASSLVASSSAPPATSGTSRFNTTWASSSTAPSSSASTPVTSTSVSSSTGPMSVSSAWPANVTAAQAAENDDDGEWEWVEDDGSPLPVCDESAPTNLPALAQAAGSSTSSGVQSYTTALTASASAPAAVNTSTLVPMQTFQKEGRSNIIDSSSIRIGRRDGAGLDVILNHQLLERLSTEEGDLGRRRKNKDEDDYDESGQGGGGQYRHGRDDSDYEGYGKNSHGGHRGEGDDGGRYDDESDEDWQADSDDSDRNGNGKVRQGKHDRPVPGSGDDEDDMESASSASEILNEDPEGYKTSSSAGSASGSARDDCANLSRFYRAMGGEDWTRKAGWSGGGDTDCCGWFGVTCESSLSRRGKAYHPFAARGWKDDYGDSYQDRKGAGGKMGASGWDDDSEGSNAGYGSGHQDVSDRKSNRKSKSKDGDEKWDGGKEEGDDESWTNEGKKSGGGQYTQNSQAGRGRVIALDLAGNGLKGPLSDALFALDGLLRIDVSDNVITSLPDQFASLSHLTHFKAANNSITGLVPASLANSRSLTNLNLANNALLGGLALAAPELLSLSVTGNQLTTISMTAPKIQRVYLANNAFAGPLPDLSQARGLTTLIAANNTFTGSLFDLSGLTNLTHLDVRSNQLTGPLPSSFSTLKSLKSLYLSSNQLTGSLPSEPAPALLTCCAVQPNPISCPSASDLADPQSLASRCHASCRRVQAAGSTVGAKSGQARPGGVAPPQNIPVAPLPGEAGEAQALAQAPSPAQTPLAPQGPGALAVPAALGLPQAGLLPPKVTSPVVGSGGVLPQGGGAAPAGSALSGSTAVVHPFIGENTSLKIAKGSAGRTCGLSAGVGAVSTIITIVTTITTFTAL